MNKEIDLHLVAELKQQELKKYEATRTGNNKAHRTKADRTQQRKAAKLARKRNR